MSLFPRDYKGKSQSGGKPAICLEANAYLLSLCCLFEYRVHFTLNRVRDQISCLFLHSCLLLLKF